MWSVWGGSMFGLELWCAIFIAFQYAGNSSVAPERHRDFPDNRQGEFARALTNYEISIPTKVTERGVHLSHSLRHFLPAGSSSGRRLRRDAATSSGSSANDDAVHYKVNVEGRDLHLRLTANDRLFAPGLVVEHRKSDRGNLTGITGRRVHDNRCHFAGEVKGHPESAAAIATCHGLHGFFRLGAKQYFIEPVKGHDPSASKGHPHLIYEKSALPAELHLPVDERDERRRQQRNEEGHGDCGVDDDKIDEDRTRPDDGKKRPRRKKRSVSLERNVETLVVVDKAMMEYYKHEDVENYVFTVMNMVSTLFHESSIGNAINIVLVRIIYLEHEERDLRIIHHADLTLKSFCRWQMTVNPRDDAHPNHHDVAILLTRVNICSRMNEPCSTLGLAEVSGLCQPHRSCNLNEDTGLALAFTVTHELGHNFGMKHDSPENGCEVTGDEEHQYVMSPQLMAEASPLVWSNCSRNAITAFLDRDWGHCLSDAPSEHDFKFPILPPGVMYDIDHQCRLQYGTEAEYCDGIDDLCTTVWCRVDKKCLTRLEAAAEGTLCGDNEWCFGGRCVTIGETPLAIDSQWGEWSSWSECTRSCGAGVSLSERLCNNPPPSHGGKYCLGERRRYRVCSTDPCPEGSPSFREQQCTDFNSIAHHGRKYQWEPEFSLATPCQLHCKSKERQPAVVLMMKDMVKDGTPCRVGRNDMCISGRCRVVGCDWMIESNAVEDRCGVCHGDGSTCKTVHDSFNKTSGMGYVEAAVIPEGARNIRVEEVEEANNYLAIRNDVGRYYLNGDFYIQWTGDYEAAGSVIQYRRRGNRESLVVPGPTKEPLHVMLLFQSQNPGITYEYTVPDENKIDTKRREYHWKHSDWTHCTMSCGGGRQISEVVCVDKEAGIVDEIYCNASIKPDDMHKPCNEHRCPARWWTGPWQHCSVSCGSGGTQKRTVLCVRPLGADEQIALEDWECEGLEKPPEVTVCKKREPCLIEDTQWQTGPWIGKCGAEEPCGLQKRVVSCLDPNGQCSMETKPPSERSCPDNDCGMWKTSGWSKCSKSCGGGEQTRIVECIGGRACPHDRKPAMREKCNRHECPRNGDHRFYHENNALHNPDNGTRTMTAPEADASADHWKLGEEDEGEFPEETPVSAEAEQSPEGERTESTTRIAESLDHENIVVTEAQNSSDAITTPSTLDFRWMSMFWSECSRPCGKGFRTRKVLCILIVSKEKVSEEHCLNQSKPLDRDACEIKECSGAWTTTPWQECSVSCGEGIQVRSVSCPLPGSCDRDEMPEEKRICSQGRCAEWIADPWQECSATCGGGKQQRRVHCIDHVTGHDAAECETSSQPPAEQMCNTQDCSRDDPSNAHVDQQEACTEDPKLDGMCRSLRQMGRCSQHYVRRKCCKACRHSTSVTSDARD